MSYQLIETAKVPIRAWVNGVEFEDEARKQMNNIANLPIMSDFVCAMADVHAGKGATVGSVIATRKSIICSALGVDIGCGVFAQKLSLKAKDLPTNLGQLRHSLERAIPVGFNDYGDKVPGSVNNAWDTLNAEFQNILIKHPKLRGKDEQKPLKQLATLGGGNHTEEICLDPEGNVWVLIHSGSRGIGNMIGTYFIEKAKIYTESLGFGLADKNLGWLDDGTELFDDYFKAFSWAQNYALLNRKVMAQRILNDLRQQKYLPTFTLEESAINCHHNYAMKEIHFGEELYITRKGAVSAKLGEMGVILGSMGTESYIVKGLGNPESYQSCSHGAGRRYSRGGAKKTFTTQDLIEQTQGVECRKDSGIIDEIPSAYKDIKAVIAAQLDLITPVTPLKQILCIKG